MSTILSWFGMTKKKVSGQEKQVGQVEKTKEQVKVFDLIDQDGNVCMSGLVEGQAINYCLFYRMHDHPVSIQERSNQP